MDINHDDQEIPDFTVRIGLWDEETVVTKIKQRRHKAKFEGGDESRVTYCNNCGCPFIIGNRCADCGVYQ